MPKLFPVKFMWLDIFFKGFFMGLIASLPSFGPVGVLSIQRTLSRDQTSGFFTGLGAAVADTIFAAVAFFSLSIVITFVEDHIEIIQAIAGILVVVIGAYILFSSPAVQVRRNRSGKGNLWQDFLSGFLITIPNLVTILSFLVLFAAWGLNKDMGRGSSIPTLLGVLVGGAVWWFAMTFAVGLLRKKFRPRHLLWFNRIAGALIMIMGIVVLIGTIFNIRINDLVH